MGLLGSDAQILAPACPAGFVQRVSVTLCAML